MAVQVSMTIRVAGDAECLVHCAFIPGGRTINKERHIEFFGRLTDAMRRKREAKWPPNSLFLKHGSTSAYRSLVVRKCLSKRNVTALELSRYSSALSPPYFFLFPRLKVF
jgi:hypothetical protein